MALPSSGTLTTAQVAQEIYGNAAAPLQIPSADVRTLVGKPSGDIIFPNDFYGKSWGPAVPPTSHAITVGGGGTGNFWGFAAGVPDIGAIAPNTTSIPVAGLTIVIAAHDSFAPAARQLSIEFRAPAQSFSAITASLRSIQIGAAEFLLSDAIITGSSSSGYNHNFAWASGNIFGTTPGATRALTLNYY